MCTGKSNYLGWCCYLQLIETVMLDEVLVCFRMQIIKREGSFFLGFMGLGVEEKSRGKKGEPSLYLIIIILS